ncbi:AAA family ATPase [Clostridium ljungdahlii]|uniref:Dephospho-CoA kinase n=1 Tax=Clostridium ljungdahlii TaxID=1538 RepID=A0A162L458_9CLOT|nr:AAA family ATPase [Clostridium ljungdahlii]OAA90882.1 Dephospho-CoA kinase [Clostridium ljungdahlii]
MRIAMVGKMRSGKDTVADLITLRCNCKHIAFADGITKVIQICFPEAFMQEKPREHYQFIGQQLRKLNPNVWVNYADRTIKDLGSITSIIITDCRQSNEEEYLRRNGFFIVKVVADDKVRLDRIAKAGESVTDEQFYHDTEKQVDLIEADYVIENNGTLAEMEKKVERLLEYYLCYIEPQLKYKKQLEDYEYEDK